MSTIPKPTTSPQAPQPSQPQASDPRAARQTALLNILGILIATLLLNAVSYSIAAMVTRLSTTPTSTPNFPKSHSSALTNEDQDWEVTFLFAPATTKLCFAANVLVGAISCFVLMHAFFIWMTTLALVSDSVRNYALAYGVGAGISGIVFVHVVLVPRLEEGDGFLMIINSVLGPVLAGLTFGTIERSTSRCYGLAFQPRKFRFQNLYK
ncbi:hypothetical protein B7463_g8357, partial [Scytalidium lignicola]